MYDEFSRHCLVIWNIRGEEGSNGVCRENVELACARREFRNHPSFAENARHYSDIREKMHYKYNRHVLPVSYIQESLK